MIKYFQNVQSEDEADSLYRELAKKFHPDIGGNEEDFKDMKNEYQECLIALKWNREIKPEYQIKKEIIKEIKQIKKKTSTLKPEIKNKLVSSGGEFGKNIIEAFLSQIIK